jgi:CRISPR-associated exonuclease Cas4
LTEDDYLYISALQHCAYCPRQFALIHVEQVWEDNRYTAEGNLLHERVDSGVAEQRQNRRFERGVLLTSHRYQLVGKMDLLEIETYSDSNLKRYFPVEYKRGKPKVESWDRVQLCAQALCIEEMRDVKVEEGAIWYWEVRRREPVVFDEALRAHTIVIIEQAHAILKSGKTPAPVQDKSLCRACSLIDICSPDQFRRDRSLKYIESIFDESRVIDISGDSE